MADNKSDTTILNEMFNPKAIITIKKDMHNKEFVTLKEQKASNSQAKIRHIPADAFVLNIDDFMSLNTIFQGAHGECKRADYVIISEEKKCIIFIELKERSDEWHNIVKQLQGSKCFIEYCQNLGQIFWQEKDFLTNYEYRFVCIGRSGSMPKKKTKVDRKANKHDTPDTAMKIEYAPTIQFNMIASLGQ